MRGKLFHKAKTNLKSLCQWRLGERLIRKTASSLDGRRAVKKSDNKTKEEVAQKGIEVFSKKRRVTWWVPVQACERDGISSIVRTMITYVYETIPPEGSGEPVRRFEYKQSIREKALTTDPLTGVAVKRVIAGGIGFLGRKQEGRARSCCGGGCGCH